MFGLRLRHVGMLLVLAGLVCGAGQYVLAYISAFQFDDFVRQEVKYAASARKPPDQLRSEIIDKAEELGFHVQPRDIQVARRGLSFSLNLEYRWPIDLKVYKHDLVFSTAASGETMESDRN